MNDDNESNHRDAARQISERESATINQNISPQPSQASFNEQFVSPAQRRNGEGRVKCTRDSCDEAMLKLPPHTLGMYYHFRTHKRSVDDMNAGGDPNTVEIDAQLTTVSHAKRLKIELQEKSTTYEMSFAPRLEVHAEIRYSKAQIELLRKRTKTRQDANPNTSTYQSRSQTTQRKKSQCVNCMSTEHIASNRICPRYKQPKLTSSSCLAARP